MDAGGDRAKQLDANDRLFTPCHPFWSIYVYNCLSCSPQIGAYHTLDLELNQVFSIEKDVWDIIHLERIETSSDPAKKVLLLLLLLLLVLLLL